jgi:NADH-quinone oxidoreductase subunit E
MDLTKAQEKEELVLKAETIERIEKLIPRYPDKRSVTLPLLHIIQEEVGYISKGAMEWIAEKLEVQPIYVYELVTFYPMLREKPIGKKHVKVCRTLSCALAGSQNVCKTFQKELNCGLNQTSEDGEFTVEFVECIASCGTAPVIQIDDKLYESVTPDVAQKMAEDLKKQVGTKS